MVIKVKMGEKVELFGYNFTTLWFERLKDM